MKRSITILALFLNSTFCAGQFVAGLDKDSMRRIVNVAPDDTSKVLTLISLGQQYENTIPDSALYYYRIAGTLSKRLSYPIGIVKYINNYTAVLNVQGKYDSSLQLNLAALALSKKYHMAKQYRLSLVNIGTVYQYKEDYASAAKYYLEALPGFEQDGNTQYLGILYGNLSGMYRNMRRYEKAMEYAQKSLSVAEKNKDAYFTAEADNNIGNIYVAYHKWEEALKYFHRAYTMGKKLDDLQIQETALLNIGDLISTTGEKKEEYEYVYNEALILADSLHDSYGKSLALLGIAHVTLNKRQFKLAKTQTKEAIRYARENGQKETEKGALLLMSDIENIMGNYTLAGIYRNAFDSLSDVLSGATLQKNIQELETKYEVEKKQTEILRKDLLISQKTKESLRQRTWLIVLGGGILLLALALFGGYRSYRHRQLLNAKALEAANAEQENIRLKASLDGQLQERQRIGREMHDDMGSGLTSMLFLSRLVQGQGEAAEKINHTAADLVQKMNEIIWTMNHEEDTLEGLVAYTRAHIADKLEEAGIAYSFKVTQPIPSLPISQEFRRNVYLTVKEAVHNIIKHAHATQVELALYLHDEMKITIQDNGCGFPDGVAYRFGNGLKNMQYRMEQLGGLFEIKSENGTCVVLRLPLPVDKTAEA
ncbi:MAG: tetratricopeptide repeat protein [Chitinophagaceae bacterium]